MKHRTTLFLAAGAVALAASLPVAATTFIDTGESQRPAELDQISPRAAVPENVLELLVDADPGGGGGTPGGGGGGVPTDPPGTDLPTPGRVSGSDRFGTAVALSARTFAPGVPVVYLATGAAFADALAAGPVATGNGPVLLVRQDAIPTGTASELARLQPGRIVVLGGVAAISDDVVDAAKTFTDGTVTRLAGADRYATAAAVSAASSEPGVPVVFVGTGTNFADALAAGPAAAGRGPVVLVRPGSIPAATAAELTRLQPGAIYVLGGPAAAGDQVVVALAEFTDGFVTRLAGSDRYATSVAISQHAFEPGVPVAFFATGVEFADALAAAPATEGAGPILLARLTCVPTPVLAELERLQPDELVVVGGANALSAAVLALTTCGTTAG